MVGSTSSGFYDLFLAGERVENMIRMGKIQNNASTSGVANKPFIAYGKKREGDTNATAVFRGRAPIYRASYEQVSVVAPIQNHQPFTIQVDQQVQQQPDPYQPQQ